MTSLTDLLHLPTARRRATPSARGTPAQDPARLTPTETPRHPARIECPACHHRAGFLLDVDGVAYRVLEDDADTELLTDLAADTPLTCAHCGTTITLTGISSTAPAPQARPRARAGDAERGRRPGSRPRIHDAATATPHRSDRHGAHLPVCPECGNTHNFLADIDGVAYHVLEDDDDTDLLPEAANLLCTRCHAVFAP